LARWYSLGILPTRPARPQDKGAVEAGVHVAENWILAPLRKRRFFSLGELNVAIAEQVRSINERPFRGQRISRRALFDELERAALQPLPPTRYEIALWKPAKVNIDYHVIDGHIHNDRSELRQARRHRHTYQVPHGVKAG